MLKGVRTQIIVAVAIGGLSGWLAASGRVAETFAQNNKAETSPVAQIQTTGTPGSPTATTTINGKQLPPPDPKFGGVIKERASESKAWWPPRVVPPKGAPNVLLIMTDDVGFSARGRSVASSRLRPWIASRRTVCVTRISIRRHSARPRDRRSLPAATITRTASAWWARLRRGSRAMTRSSRRRTAPSAKS